ncbi:Cro/Cl family transcriptional regulator [Sesbania bispinosa]|nr:Cro/Cl family transcriptional regulator [Sesbania bispinosa]
MARRSKTMRVFCAAALAANPQTGVVPPPIPWDEVVDVYKLDHDIFDPVNM